LVLAHWDQVDEAHLERELFNLFHIRKDGCIDEQQSMRPHILLFSLALPIRLALPSAAILLNTNLTSS
jgi:hypothetical protein